VRANVSPKDDGGSLLLVDSSRLIPLALDDTQWTRAGVDVRKLTPDPASPQVRTGHVPSLKLGGFDLPQVPAMEGGQLAEVKSAVDVDLGGIVGAGLLAVFRVTFGDEGRWMWIEPDPTLTRQMQGPPPVAPGSTTSPAPVSTQPPVPNAASEKKTGGK
jgi:hypothetical protein